MASPFTTYTVKHIWFSARSDGFTAIIFFAPNSVVTS